MSIFPGPSVSIDYGDGFDGVNDANDDIDINDDEPPARDENLTNRPGSAYCNCISITLAPRPSLEGVPSNNTQLSRGPGQ